MKDAGRGALNDPQGQRATRSQRRARSSRRFVWGIAAALAVGASFAAMALASSVPTTVGSAANSTLGKRVVVSAKGRTLYALSPETSHHLLCTSAECMKAWPPLTVPSRKTKLKAGPGVQGHLGILARHGGLLQVTLRGVPLYRFSHDRAKGEANGEGIESFGGTWHAVPAASSSGSMMPAAPTTPAAPTPTNTTPTTPEPTPGYGY
jgi:predicted lipoprotein with Yx(FWY)xxD motif